MSMDSFSGKTVIITGGASGIGRALGEELCRAGAKVVLGDVNAELLSSTAEPLRSSGCQVNTAIVDVTDFEAVKALVEETAREHGQIDYLFNNAGIVVGGEARDVPLDDWRAVIDTSLYGVVHGVLAAYPIMLKQGSGHIVNTASGAGLVPSPLLTAYSMTKHAVVGLSTGIRAEGAALGVKVSVVCPGFIDTPIFDSTEYVNTSKEIGMSVVPSGLKAMSAADCARAALRGVARNRGIIPVQAPAHILWWLNRLSPRIMDGQSQKMIQKYRKAAREKRS